METKRRWSQPINWCNTQKQKKILTIAIFAGLNEKKVSVIKEYVKNFRRRIRKKIWVLKPCEKLNNRSPRLLGYIMKQCMSAGLENARISTVTSVLCRSVIPKMRPNECSDISTLSSVANLRVQLDFFFMVAQYQLRHKITCRILNLKYAGKKKGMGKESLTVSMETNPCIVDPINCHQWPL